MTRHQKNKNQTSNSVQAKNHAPSNEEARHSGMVPSNSKKEHKCKLSNSFDIIQYYRELRIQIYLIDYLKPNPNQLQMFVEHYNNKDGGHDSMNANIDHHKKANNCGVSLNNEDLALPKFFQ